MRCLRTMQNNEKTNPNLLVIESDQATRSGMKRLLEMHGYIVNAVANENEAETVSLQREYDLILFDTNLPPPESFSAAHRVHQRPKLKHIPLLAISVHEHFGVSFSDPEIDQFSVVYVTDLNHFDDLEKLSACLLNKK